MAIQTAAVPTDTSPQGPGVNYSAHLQIFVFALFFAFGGITSLNDIIIPKLKALFTLTHAQSMLVQSAFFAAYFIISIPAAGLVRHFGYMRTAVIGLLAMTAGCVLFIPASSHGVYGLFLFALFVLAAGITTVQVVANPLISLLGAPATASSRLTFAQAFNSLGTTIFPFVGAFLILGSTSKADPQTLSGAALDAFRGNETRVIVYTYLALAAALSLLAVVVWLQRNALSEKRAAEAPLLEAFNLLLQPRFAFGALCIFLYVGGEVAIGSMMTNYLMQDSVWAVSADVAGSHVALYWGGAMVGRFVGAYVLQLAAPGKVLAVGSGIVIALLLMSAETTGSISGWALLSIGLFNSIMFPTIFSLASEGLGRRAAEGSGVICMAIVGGAVVPVVTGAVADVWNPKTSLLVPALCYGGILLFGWYARRPVVTTRA